jgi:hypothetical protein
MSKSQFPNTNVSFKDTLNCGAISLRGFMLECDEDGFIEGPADIEQDIKPHGFVKMERPKKSNTLGLPGKR